MKGRTRFHVLFRTDLAVFINLLALAATGIAIEYILPAGPAAGTPPVPGGSQGEFDGSRCEP